MRIFFIISVLTFLNYTHTGYCFQDTTRKVSPDSSTFFVKDIRLKYLNPLRPDTISRKSILWYPIKTFEDLLEYIPGFYLKFKDVGQLNPYLFNQGSNMIFFKHGRPFDYDLNFLSRNEVEEIETDAGFGNNLYKYSGILNVIQRQIFRNRPYTEINFYQDRYENLFLDGSYHQNIFNKLNLNFGITKHSYEGHYINSQFDKWLGRFNLNYAPTLKINLYSYFSYGWLERGLNDGINSSLVNISDKESMFNKTKAVVNNKTAYEQREKFDIDAGTYIKWNGDNISNVHIYGVTEYSGYRDSALFSESKRLKGGIRLQHIFKVRINSDLYVSSRSEAGYVIWKLNQNQSVVSQKTFSFLEDAGFEFLNNTVRLYFSSSMDDQNIIYNDLGFSGVSIFGLGKKEKIILDVFHTTIRNYSRAKVSLESFVGDFSAEVYRGNDGFNKGGINLSAGLYFFKVKIISNYSYLLKTGGENTLPRSYGLLNLAYSDVAIRNKFEYRIGVQSRFWSHYIQYLDVSDTIKGIKIPANFTFDFYIKARIGRVYTGLVFENIFNRLIYNSAVYPFMDRGGLFNVLSRFDITWNFFD